METHLGQGGLKIRWQSVCACWFFGAWRQMRQDSSIRSENLREIFIHKHSTVFYLDLVVSCTSLSRSHPAYLQSNQVMGWGEKAIELRSASTGNLEGVFMHKKAQKLKFLCERNDKVQGTLHIFHPIHTNLVLYQLSTVVIQWNSLKCFFTESRGQRKVK